MSAGQAEVDARGRARALLALFAFTLVIWLTHLQMPMQGSPDDHDNSWSRALGYTFVHGMQAGVDWLFTAGPLGTFHNAAYEPTLYWRHVLVWECGVKLLAAFALARVMLRLSGAFERLAFAFAIVLVRSTNDAYAVLAMLAACAWILERTMLARPAFAVGLVLLPAFALAKFTLFSFAFVCVATLAWFFARERSVRAALGLLAACALALAAAWKLAGQALANLPTYLARSWQITSGYSDAMSYAAPPRAALLGVIALASAVALAALGIASAPRTRARTARALLLLASFYVMHKAGFTRGDHAFIFFGFAAAAPYLVAQPGPEPALLRTLALLLRLACVVVCTIGLCVNAEGTEPWWRQLAGGWAGSATQAAIGIGAPRAWQRMCDERRAQVTRDFDLPLVRARVGRRTIDAISWDQSLLFVNGLEWKPRLTFQSYSVYTRELALANARCYESAGAPDFVLFKLQTIDARLPMMDDGPLMQVLTRDWRPVLVERGYVLLEHHPLTDAGPPDELVLERTVKFDQTLDVGSLPGKCHMLSIEIEKTVWGELRTFFDKAPPLRLEVITEGGSASTYRIVPGMIAAGALLRPFIQSQSDWDSWLRGLAGARPARLRVLAPADPSMYASELRVQIVRTDRSVPCPEPDIERILLGGLLPALPTTMHPAARIARAEVDDRSALLVHAPSAITCELAPGAHVLNTGFGLMPESYESGQTDGVRFTVSVREDGAEGRVLFERLLEPKRTAADRGSIALALEFDTSAPARLVLRTDIGPNDDGHFDWAYWRAIEVR